MRLLLSGTSNSIIAKGIGTAFATDPRVSVFTNASYGASGTVAIGDHLRGIDFADYDVCVLDYCVNEEVLLYMGVTQLEDALSNIHAMIDAASRAGCLPVLAVFANDTRMNFPRPLEEALLEKLVPAGVPVFNIYDYIESLSQRYDLAPMDMFLDPNHVHRALSHFVGREIVSFLETLDFSGLRLHEPDLWYRRLGFVPHGDLAVVGSSHETEQSTSILTRRLLHVDPGARIVCQPANRSELAGVSYNAARSWGELSDRATGTVVARIEYNNLFSLRRGLTLVTWPVKQKLESNGEPFELDYRCDPLEGEDRPPPGLQIQGLILRDLTARCPLAVLGEPGEGTRIERIVAQNRERPFVEELRTVIAERAGQG